MKESLRVKVFRMNIVPVALAVILFMILGIFQVRRFAGIMEKTNLEQNTVIMDTMSDSMREIAMEDFQKYVVSEAKVLNGEFWMMRHDLEILASQVQMVLEQPSSNSGVDVSPPSLEDAGTLTLQLLYSDDADRSDPEMQEQIRQIGGLGNMMREIIGSGETLLDCVIALPGGASIIADYMPEAKVQADGQIRSFNADRRPWYAGAVVHKRTYFTPVNKDSFSEEYQVMVGVPVYVDGKLAAVCGGSVRMSTMGEIASNAQLGDYTDSCLINENGNVLYSSRTDGELELDANNLKSLKESSNAELVALVKEALEGVAGFSRLTVDGEEIYIAYAPVEMVGWTQMLMVTQEDLNSTAYLLMQKTDGVMEKSLTDVRNNERSTILTTLFIAAILLVLAALLSMFFANGLVRPIRSITRRVSQIQENDMTFQMENIMLTGDEIEVLARSFENMSKEMKGYVNEIVQITSEKQRLETELFVASEIQVNMLPTHFPAFPDRNEFDLYAVMDPAREVGGDFYDFFLIDDDHLALVMADVSGKGVPAALFMVISKTLIKNVTLSGMYDGPADILSDVNNKLCEGNDDNMFVTVWLGILTISTGSLVSACAGHEYPVFYRKSKGFILEKDPHGMAMGGLEGLKYRQTQWTLDPGDMLFLYTDGVPEANNNAQELFGNGRMIAALEKSRNIILGGESDAPDLYQFLRVVREQIDEFVGDTPQFDDLTMLCLDYRGPGRK